MRMPYTYSTVKDINAMAGQCSITKNMFRNRRVVYAGWFAKVTSMPSPVALPRG